MAQVTLSENNEIVIPPEARAALGVKAGDKLLVVVRGSSVIVMQEPTDYQSAIHGLSRGTYPPDYLEKERQSWD
jgi:AbrB family looped-hinge helix DNA binding protein